MTMRSICCCFRKVIVVVVVVTFELAEVVLFLEHCHIVLKYFEVYDLVIIGRINKCDLALRYMNGER